MKNLARICCIAMLLGCGNTEQKNAVKAEMPAKPETPMVPPALSKTDSAKMLIDSANYWVSKGIRGEMKNTEVNKIVDPMMANFFRIYKELPPEDTAVVYKYRIMRVNELIDLQMDHDKRAGK